MSNPLSYYTDLITSQYNNSVRFKAWLNVNLTKLQNNSVIVDMLDNHFDIDIAIGVQLDVLGVILGRSRILKFQPTDNSNPVLNDDMYRKILKVKILINQWNGEIESLSPYYKEIFPDSDFIVKDNQDMTMSVLIKTNNLLIRDLVINGYIVPKPQGVRINYFFGNYPFFGYDLKNEYVDSYDIGKWAESVIPVKFAYDVNNLIESGYDFGNWN